MCLKEFCFAHYWNILSFSTLSMTIKENSTAKDYHFISLFSVVSKIFEKLVITGLLISSKNAASFLILIMVTSLLLCELSSCGIQVGY